MNSPGRSSWSEKELIEAAFQQVADVKAPHVVHVRIEDQDCMQDTVTLPSAEFAGTERSSPVTSIGPYLLKSRLGRGSYGEVWLAERRSSLAVTTLAVKLLTNTVANLDLVRNEAETWVRAAHHPNVLPFFEAEIYDGRLLLASEYAAGGSLQDWLESRNDVIPPQDAIELTMGILGGLEHLHLRGIVHRDLKAANILLQGGFPRIADFGLSRWLDAPDDKPGRVGSPAYMAPECYVGEGSVQADLWAVTVLLYFMVTGRFPFVASDLPSLINQITDSRPRLLDGPASSLQPIIDRGLCKAPEDRFRSAAEMRAVLRDQLRLIEYSSVSLAAFPSRGCRTIAITGSMSANKDRCLSRLRMMVSPFLGRETTWYCGTTGDVDETVIRFLLGSDQRVIAVGYRRSDISPEVEYLLARSGAPFVDAESEEVPLDASAPSLRDVYFSSKADLVIVFWNGKSLGTKRLLEWLRVRERDHLLILV